MTRIPRGTAFLAALAGVALAGLGASTVSRAHRAPPAAFDALRGAVVASGTTSPSRAARGERDSVTAAGTGAPVRAAIALQLSDCSGNLRLLDLIHRSTVRHAITLEALWNVGNPADSARVRALLPRWTRDVPIVPAPSGALHELASLGHRSSPMLVLLDQASRVRLVTGSPGSAREFAGLRRAIEGLSWFDDL